MITDLFTTRQVQDLLKVDRITIYRMLQDGRLSGVKIGQQWRFARSEVERLLSGARVAPAEPAALPAPESAFPVNCIQSIQDLYSDLSRMSALVVDRNGRPVTQISGMCALCQLIMSSPEGAAACRETWRMVASLGGAGVKSATCHAGLQYISAPIMENDQTAGYFITGQFYWHAPDAREQSERLRRLAAQFDLPFEELRQAADSVTIIPQGQQAEAERWPQTAARAVEHTLKERTGLIQRLQQIANLTQIP